MQHGKEVVSGYMKLEDFAIGLVNSVLNFPSGQVRFFGNSNYRRIIL